MGQNPQKVVLCQFHSYVSMSCQLMSEFSSSRLQEIEKSKRDAEKAKKKKQVMIQSPSRLNLSF